ncbi:MAG: hypothetical protein V3S35_00075, partial [Nitrosomonadaceae bacterium]
AFLVNKRGKIIQGMSRLEYPMICWQISVGSNQVEIPSQIGYQIPVMQKLTIWPNFFHYVFLKLSQALK